MKITELVLHNYERFALNNIETFTYRPQQKSQVILGSNGSGKSSLISELSPIPAKAKSFNENGYKRITIEHNDNIYVLTSDSHNKHSFIENGIELNNGNTLQVQKMLVMDKMRLNDKVYDILTGKVNLCDMSIAERRKWLTEISNNDYEYVMDLYNAIKAKYNESNTELKITNQLLSTEQSTILSDEEITNLKDEIISLQTHVDSLLKLKTNSRISESEVIGQLNNIQNTIAKNTNTLMSFRNRLNFTNITTVDNNLNDYTDKKISLTKQIYHYEKLIEQKVNESTLIQKSVSELENQLSDEYIEHELNKVNQILSSHSDIFTDDDIENVYRQFRSIKDPLINILTDMESNEDRRYSKSNLQSINDTLVSSNEKLNTLKYKESSIRATLNTLESSLKSHQVVCPNCSHEWIPGYNKAIHDNSKKDLEIVVKEIDDLKIEISKLEETRTNIINYFNQYRMILDLFKNYPLLDNTYSLLKNTILDNPSKCIYQLHTLDTKYQRSIDYYKALNYQKELINKKTISDEDRNKSILKYNTQLIDIEKEILSLSSILKKYKLQYKLIEDHLNLTDSIDNISNKLKQDLNEYNNVTLEYLNIKMNEVINGIVSPLMASIVDKQNIVTSIFHKQDQINSLQDKVNQISLKVQSYKTLLDIMSPKTGIIAESLIGFINEILSFMNSFMANVWTYKMVISPIEMDNSQNESLDYKFKLDVEGHKPIEDISLGSSGMKEIINLAFRLCIYKYLDFRDYPLYLDEFGKALDEGHRKKATIVVNDLINDDSFNNIFIISHYKDSYGAVQHADIVVLDESNVNVSNLSNINSVVEIL